MIHARAAISVLFLVTCARLAAAQSPETDSLAERGETWSRPSNNGSYRISLASVDGTTPIARIHEWVIHVETAQGDLFTPRQLVISGGMPGHGHGFSTEPQITRYLGNGDYLVEGIKFHMPGTWEITVGVTGPAGPDSTTFTIEISSAAGSGIAASSDWSTAEVQLMKSLALSNLPPTAIDRSNRFSGNQNAARLGESLFLDKGLSGTNKVACANCHKPQRLFADDKRFSVGSKATSRNAPGLLGVSHYEWFYWDGRRDSLWAQAITPLETQGEMDSSRTDVVRYVLGNATYAGQLAELGVNVPDMSDKARFPVGAGPFGSASSRADWQKMQPADRESVNRTFSDIGKVMAAYMEELQPGESRFDRFVSELTAGDAQNSEPALTIEEQEGLRLFLDVGRTFCLRCHNGPLFTNFGFHNIATSETDNGIPDFGRMLGLQAALVDEFNCRGKYSDAAPGECEELRFAVSEESAYGAFKVPGLRGVAATAPYMHDGRFVTLEETVGFYTLERSSDEAPSELPPVSLTDIEISQIVAFLGALSPLDLTNNNDD